MSSLDIDAKDFDPASEFLAREQNDIAGLEDELSSNLSVAGSSRLNSIGDSVLNFDDSMMNLDSSELNFDGSDSNFDNSVINFVNSDIQFENSAPNIEGLSLMDLEDENFCPDKEDSEENSRNQYYVSIKSWFEESVVKKLEESEKVKKWREENRKMLEEKDAKEAKEKEEMRLQAKKDLDEWYKNYEESLVKRSIEADPDELLAAGDGEKEVDSEWKKIVEFCDLNSKLPHITKDVSRFKEVLLSLKQNPLQKSK